MRDREKVIEEIAEFNRLHSPRVGALMGAEIAIIPGVLAAVGHPEMACGSAAAGMATMGIHLSASRSRLKELTDELAEIDNH